MNIKINANNKEQLQRNLNEVLNVATFVCLQGYIPTKDDILNAGTTGNWWYKKSDTTYDLNPLSNNYWAFIRSTDDNTYIEIEFGVRYDDKNNVKKNSLAFLLVCWFDFVQALPSHNSSNENQSQIPGFAM